MFSDIRFRYGEQLKQVGETATVLETLYVFVNGVVLFSLYFDLPWFYF